MIDIEKQVAYWRQSAQEDWAVAQELLGRNRIRHGLFFAFLALEKILKAHVCRHTNDLAPCTHNLVRLAETSGLELSPNQTDVLAEMNEFAMAGRYPDTTSPVPTHDEGKAQQAKAQEVFQWLIRQL